jgi:hypothetical protein
MLHREAKQEDAKDTTLANSILAVVVGDVVAVFIIIEEFSAAPLIKNFKQGEEEVQGRVGLNSNANTTTVDLAKCVNPVQSRGRNFAVRFKCYLKGPLN